MKIAILDDYQDVVKGLDCFSLLNDFDTVVLNETYTDVKELVKKIKDAEVLVLIRERTIVTEELLKQLPNLKFISQTGRLSSNVNVELCKKYGVEVMDGKGSPIAPAELCWNLIMTSWRNSFDYIKNFQNNIWQHSSNNQLGKVLCGYTLGIWGYGKIGQKIAKYANVFDMNIVIWGSESSRQKAIEDGFKAAKSKDEFFSSCDIISIHLKLNENTKYCVTKEDLSKMKDESLFVNVSRAELVEENALYEVLKENKNKKVAIDVFDVEPTIPKYNKLLQLPNVLATPHLGYVEKNNYELYFKIAFENVLKFISK